MARQIDTNKKRPGMNNMSAKLAQAASDKVSSNSSSVFTDNSLEKEKDSILKLDNGTPTKYIHRDLIYPNPLNFPYMEGITEDDFQGLKAALLDMGLMHNLVVINDGNGRFRLVSGEKRWQAISRMTDDEYKKAFPNGIEAKVLPYNPDLSEIDEKIMLLSCNVLVFSNASPDPRQLRDLILLYQQKGYEYEKNELVSFLNFYMKKNTKTIYKFIAETNATDELYELFTRKILVRSALQILGDLSPEEQHEVCTTIKEQNIDKVDEALASTIKKSIKDRKKKDKAESTENTYHYIKFDKTFNNATADLEKLKKIHYENMSSTEISLAIARLDIMRSEIKELKEQLLANDKKTNSK